MYQYFLQNGSQKYFTRGNIANKFLISQVIFIWNKYFNKNIIEILNYNQIIQADGLKNMPNISKYFKRKFFSNF